MTGFLVVSLPRSGSMVTAFTLNEYCKTQSGNLEQNVIHIKKNSIANFTKDHVYHAHDKNNIKIMPRDYTLIVNQRDPFDMTVSRMVAEKLDKWHCWNYQVVETKNVNLTIDLDLFTNYYERLINENKLLLKIANTVPHYKINYNDIKDNNLNNIFKICNIDYEMLAHHRSIPTKFNLDYPNIIPNYGELLDYAISRGRRKK